MELSGDILGKMELLLGCTWQEYQIYLVIIILYQDICILNQYIEFHSPMGPVIYWV